ncbi:MAG TPA: C4-type zinc ribbon domain-containing protein [Bacillota bacterium]|nr:C4-type zinc ribbon domain-containing protein [Bacillota bacterium]
MAILPILHRVQEVESRLRQLEQALQQLNENPNLTALQLLQSNLVRTRQSTENDLQQLKSRQRQLDLELKSCQERLQHEESKLYNGSIVLPRELEQLQQKVSEYQNLRSKLEEDLLQLMERDEVSTAELTGMHKREATTARELAQIREELQQQALEINFEKEQLQMELVDLLPQIPGEWLERYRRIAKAHRGIGIAKLKQNSCGACHVGLSESILHQVKRGEDKLIFCENCGRILYFS